MGFSQILDLSLISSYPMMHIKGQLVSKCLFDVFNFSQKTMLNGSTKVEILYSEYDHENFMRTISAG